MAGVMCGTLSLAVLCGFMSLSRVLVHCFLITFELDDPKLRLVEKVCPLTTYLTLEGSAGHSWPVSSLESAAGGKGRVEDRDPVGARWRLNRPPKSLGCLPAVIQHPELGWWVPLKAEPARANCVFLREVISTVVGVKLVSVSGSITELRNTSIAQLCSCVVDLSSIEADTLKGKERGDSVCVTVIHSLFCQKQQMLLSQCALPYTALVVSG